MALGQPKLIKLMLITSILAMQLVRPKINFLNFNFIESNKSRRMSILLSTGLTFGNAGVVDDLTVGEV